MEHQSELLVGVAPCLACEMLLGHDWPLIYDVLERVQDAEVKRWQLKGCEGWLGELKGGRETEGSTEETDLHEMMSGPQFREAQEEDEELWAIKDPLLETRVDQPEMSLRTPWYEVRDQLLYWVQRGRQRVQEEAQLVVPAWLHQVVWQLVHANPMGGHPGLGEDIACRCAACPECQQT